MAKTPKSNAAAKSLAKAVASSTLPFYLLDSEGKLVFANTALSRWLGVPADQLIGMACSTPLATQPATLVQDGSERMTPDLAAFLSCPSVPGSRMIRSPLPHKGVIDSEAKEQTSWERHAIRLEATGRGWTLCVVVPKGDSKHSLGTPEGDLGEEELLHRALVGLRSKYASIGRLTMFVGSSSEAKRTLNQIQAAIASNASVCIRGVEGVGKREAARAIFVGRTKRLGIAETQAQLYPVDCQLMDASLLANIFEVMDANTPRGLAAKTQSLLLDRIDRLPQDAHEVLWRYIQRTKGEGILATSEKPLWNSEETSACWRLIAASIEVLQIDIAPLSNRTEDIPLLVQAMLYELLQEKTILEMPLVLPDVMDTLQSYSWPKNVVELQQTIQSVCRSQPLKIEASQLPIAIRSFASFVETQEKVIPPIDLDRVLLDAESTILKEALRLYPGNRALAARQLGISRTRLLRRIEQLGLESSVACPSTETDAPSSLHSISEDPLIAANAVAPRPERRRNMKPKKETERTVTSDVDSMEEEIEFIEIDADDLPKDSKQ